MARFSHGETEIGFDYLTPWLKIVVVVLKFRCSEILAAVFLTYSSFPPFFLSGGVGDAVVSDDGEPAEDEDFSLPDLDL